jgi:hypothetical protein
MVAIYTLEGLTLQEGIDHTATRGRDEITQFVQLSEVILLSAHTTVRGFVDGLKFWICGYQDWVTYNTQRYLVKHASSDADDRGLLN